MATKEEVDDNVLLFCELIPARVTLVVLLSVFLWLLLMFIEICCPCAVSRLVVAAVMLDTTSALLLIRTFMVLVFV